MKHTYYQIILKLKSPLSVGSGMNEVSDSDVILDGRKKPYIPAASIAGAMRHYIKNVEKRKDIFGYINGGRNSQGKIIFYDAVLISESFQTVRDSVKLKNKVAEAGAKFDFQVVETGAEFVTYLEILKENDNICEDAEMLISAVQTTSLRFGKKTSRGYGITEIKSLKKIEFDFENNDEISAWLDFDATDMKSWKNISEYKLKLSDHENDVIKLSLKQDGAVSIRVYTTDVSNDNAMPDYKQMTLRNGIPVISGTSWAGAFRERFCTFAGEQTTDNLFGYVDKNNSGETVKSRVTFSESEISDFTMKKISRNSIDRFSGGTKDTALYTEITCYNGKTELIITIPKNTGVTERAILSAVILDLNKGYLSVGGLTSVGRGMFEVEKINFNGIDRTQLLKSENAELLLKGE